MSPKPQPLSLLNQLAKRRRDLEDHFRESFLLDEVAAQRLCRDLRVAAGNNGQSEQVRGALFHELAYVEALRGNQQSALDYIVKAELSGLNELSITLSRAYLFSMFGRFLDARTTLESCSIQDSPESSYGAFRGLCEEVGMYSVASNIEIKDHPTEYLSKDAHCILESFGIDDLEVTTRLDFAAAIVTARAKHRLLAYDLFAMEGEGILFRFVVDAAPDELLKLDWDISEAIAEKFDGPLDTILSIGIKPFSKGERHFEYGAYHAHI